MQELSHGELAALTQSTLGHYEEAAQAFWEGTRNHDVQQNVQALLSVLPQRRCRILDFGCGPGRDVQRLAALGHEAVGLDGCAAFVAMARKLTRATIWHQDFLAVDLPAAAFDGVFANASLFHVPTQELPRVLAQLYRCLVPGGALFCSNPRGADVEGYQGARYGAYHSEARWTAMVSHAGFVPLSHFYRPAGLPREQQPWLATVWRKPDQTIDV